MLTLNRRIGEIVTIGNEITVTILGITGSQVRLGIKAPKEIPVHREEIYQRIQTARRADEAPGTSDPDC